MKKFISFCLLFLLISSMSYAADGSVKIKNRQKIIEHISKVSGLNYSKAEKLFRKIYVAAIDHYYYDQYFPSDIDFCDYFSTLLAIIETESHFNPKAIAKRGRRISGVGLMQINYSYWKKRINFLKLSYLYDVYLNVRMGSRILLLELNRGIPLEKALKIYVGAQNNTYLATDYVYKVLSRKAKYQSLICPIRMVKK